jgi:hypothetical protein
MCTCRGEWWHNLAKNTGAADPFLLSVQNMKARAKHRICSLCYFTEPPEAASLSGKLVRHHTSLELNVTSSCISFLFAAFENGTFIGLAIAYAILAIVALIQLIRISQRVPQYGWTTQKVFHLLNLFVCVLRAIAMAFRFQLEVCYNLCLQFPKSMMS